MGLELVTTPVAVPGGYELSTRADLGSRGWADIKEDLSLPERFVAVLESEEQTVEMLITTTEQQLPVCEAIKITKKSGILGRDLRSVPVEEWTRLACSRIGVGEPGVEWDEDYRADVGRQVGREVKANRRRNVTTPEFLERVAAIYRENADNNPVEQVAKAFGVSKAAARKYLTLCRPPHNKFLPETTRGKVTI